jgi:uncharacterized protein (TIGR02246 family)
MRQEAARDVVTTVLDRWADGIARHDSAAVAGEFADDSLFQGFDPAPVFGRAAVAAYYEKQPIELRARYELRSVRPIADDAVLGYAKVDFDRPDGVVEVYLTVLLRRSGDTWSIAHYHVSRIA